MGMNSIEERLRSIIRKLSAKDVPQDFDDTAHVFRDLGIESTKALELLFEIEDEFQLTMPDLEYNACQHLRDLVNLIEKLETA